MQYSSEKPFINLPNGKRISFGYLSRVANGEKQITLEQLKRSHMWSLLEPAEQTRLLGYFRTDSKTQSGKKIQKVLRLEESE